MRRDAEALLAPQWAEMVMSCEQPLFQPIGDLVSPQMAVGRVALLGDAAFVARPHAARGAIKAGHDAMALAATFSPGRVTEACGAMTNCGAPPISPSSPKRVV